MPICGITPATTPALGLVLLLSPFAFASAAFFPPLPARRPLRRRRPPSRGGVASALASARSADLLLGGASRPFFDSAPGDGSTSTTSPAAAEEESSSASDMADDSAILDEDAFDRAALSLRSGGGVATIDLPPPVSAAVGRCFVTAREALDVAAASSSSDGGDGDGAAARIRTIGPDDDSAHATGYHPAGDVGSMSRYNAHREGFVFSDGELFDVPLLSGSGGSFRSAMGDMFRQMHDEIACGVLRAAERNLGLEGGWFQSQLGPTGGGSQWHLKRYVGAPSPRPAPGGKENAEGANAGDGPLAEDDGEAEWLPVHTDPSLISVVLHDVPGKNGGAMGLQYQAPLPAPSSPDDAGKGGKKRERAWKEVPHHGHGVATVFVGSVLSYITGGAFPAAKHRVVYEHCRPSTPGNGKEGKSRVAATLFVRPRPDALLTVPPGSQCEGAKVRRNCTFRQWSARVSRNYMKGRGAGGGGKDAKVRRGAAKGGKSPKRGTAPAETDGGKRTQEATGAAAPDAEECGEPSTSPLPYYRDADTELTLHPCVPPLSGQEKFLGGELHPPTGRIYAIPGHARRVLRIDPAEEPPAVEQIGPEFRGEFKWLRGVYMNGAIYGIPCHADSILKIVPATKEGEEDEITTIGWDASDRRAPPVGLKWKWHGGAVSPHDDCFYAIPQAADHVLKLDPANGDKVSFLGPPFPGRNLWYGGLVGPSDGAVYGICQNATGVLRIDPLAQDAKICGNFPPGGYKWHGGVVGPDGAIYGIPAHADSVLRIVPPAEDGGDEPEISTFGAPLRTGAHRSDGKYKYLGGAVGVDGCVYFFPSDADRVLRVDPRNLTATEVGPNLRGCEDLRHNKWQNGFSAGGGRAIYGIPLKARSIVRILCKEDGGEPDVRTVGGPYQGLNKWEGGVMSATGDMYCMPLNSDWVLRMRPVGANAGEGDGRGKEEEAVLAGSQGS